VSSESNNVIERKALLGGREHLKEIEENEINDMEISRVRGLHGLSNITKFRALTSLKIVDYTNRIEYNSLEAPDACEADTGAFLLFTNYTRRSTMFRNKGKSLDHPTGI